MDLLPRFRITNALSTMLARIERARGFIEGVRLSDDWIAAMEAWACIVEAYHSSRLAGLSLTLDQAERIVAGVIPDGTAEEEVRLLRAGHDALGSLRRSRPAGGLDEGWILDLHRRVMGIRSSQDAESGGYRTARGAVIDPGSGQAIIDPPPPEDVPRLISGLISWLASEHGAGDVLAAGIVQILILQIRPFDDGSGRTARLLSLDSLHRSGYDLKGIYSLSEPYDLDRSGYARAIRSASGGRDLTTWLEYFCSQLAAQMSEVQERAERVVRREEIARVHPLSQRQRTALAHALLHGSITTDQYEKLCPGASRSTIRKDLRGMVDRGLLVVEGNGKQRSYRLARTAV